MAAGPRALSRMRLAAAVCARVFLFSAGRATCRGDVPSGAALDAAGGARAVACDAHVAPPLLALAGWLVLLARSLRSPPRLAVALLPGLGLLGYLYFTVSYPTPDGDVLKASYMLTTAPAWALAFGYAIDRLPRRTRIVVVALLAASALAALPFLLY